MQDDGPATPAPQACPTSCRAPAVSMYFDVDGSVLACCHNRVHPLGDARTQPLADIWAGRPRRELVAHLAAGDLGHGCHPCAPEIASGARSATTAATFDGFEPGEWPARLEFALSNRCNLACVMCNGDLSSRIRAERDHLPPLRPAYGESFFEQLRPFLRHARQCRFLGGEPFLIPEYHRIWDLMVEEGSTAECNVTTNGTIRTARIEALLEALPFSIGVSIDGATRATVEAVRSGADFDTVRENASWFARSCRERGTSFGLTYCLMTVNWHELADFLLDAERLDAGVAVNRVLSPARYSLHHLPPDELEQVVRGLEARDPDLRGRLRADNLAVWDAQRASLADELARRSERPTPTGDDSAGLLAAVLDAAPFGSEAAAVAALADLGRGPVSGVRVDLLGRIAGTLDGTFFDVEEADLVGRPSRALAAVLGERFGGELALLGDRREGSTTAHAVRFAGPEASTTILFVSFPLGAPAQQVQVAVEVR